MSHLANTTVNHEAYTSSNTFIRNEELTPSVDPSLAGDAVELYVPDFLSSRLPDNEQNSLDITTVQNFAFGESSQTGIIVYIYAIGAIIFVLGVCFIIYSHWSTLVKMTAHLCCFRCCHLKCLSKESTKKQNEVSIHGIVFMVCPDG